MKNFLLVFGGGLLAAILTLIVFLNVDLSDKNPVGSVVQGHEYHSNVVITGGTKTSVLKTDGGALGSIILTATSLGNIVVYDATTTDATKRATAATTSLSVIGRVDAGTPAGTYTFDAVSFNGLMYDMTTVSSSTITWR